MGNKMKARRTRELRPLPASNVGRSTTAMAVCALAASIYGKSVIRSQPVEPTRAGPAAPELIAPGIVSTAILQDGAV